jgi:hypothetical protein
VDADPRTDLAVTANLPLRPKEPLRDRSVEGAGPLGRRDLHQRDVEVWPSVAPLGPDYIRSLHGPVASNCSHFRSTLGFHRHSVFRVNNSASMLRSATAATSHANQDPGSV